MNKERNRRPAGRPAVRRRWRVVLLPRPRRNHRLGARRLRERNCTTPVATHSTPAQTGNGNLPQRQAGAIEDDHSFLPGPESRLPHRGHATESDANLRHKNGCVNSTKHIISMPYPYCAKCRLTACKGVLHYVCEQDFFGLPKPCPPARRQRYSLRPPIPPPDSRSRTRQRARHRRFLPCCSFRRSATRALAAPFVGHSVT